MTANGFLKLICDKKNPFSAVSFPRFRDVLIFYLFIRLHSKNGSMLRYVFLKLYYFIKYLHLLM